MTVSVNGERLWQSLMDLARIGATPKGGRFDGCYGVMAGLEVVRTLNEQGITTEAPLALAICTNEEGTRFVPVMMGSGVHCGVFPLETALSATDVDGLVVRDALAAIGYAGSAPIGTVQAGSYLEAHIEQGPILEAEDTTIGVVTGSLGLRWYDVTVSGMEAHAGPTPMALRRDALYAATHLMQAVVDIANAPEFAPAGRGTVGVVNVHPASRNVIPGRVAFTVDLRHEDAALLDRMEQRLRAAAAALAAGETTGTPVQVDIAFVQEFPPTPFDRTLVARVRREAVARGSSHRDIVTGAGHDAVYMARCVPTAMIFVPCKDGISHNEVEDADPRHLEAGANVLLGAMLSQAA